MPLGFRTNDVPSEGTVLSWPMIHITTKLEDVELPHDTQAVACLRGARRSEIVDTFEVVARASDRFA